MTEEEFIESIDACFPYSDAEASAQLVQVGCDLSPNAAFMVVHELARAPSGIAPSCLKALPDLWSQEFDHPLKSVVESICRLMLRDVEPTRDQYLAALTEIKNYPGQYNALGVVHSSRSDGDADKQYESVVRAWEAGAV